MKVLKLAKRDLFPYLDALREHREVWGAVKKGDKYVHAQLEDVKKLDLSCLRTLIPPKKFFVPQRLDLLSFEQQFYKQESLDVPERVLFGLHPCDLHGLMILDRVFLERFPDPYYAVRRKRTAVIGLSCVPDDKCMAKSTNTHYVEGGFDLALTDLGDFYLVWVGSSMGDDLVRFELKLFDESISEKDLKRYVEWRKWRDAQYKVDYDLTGFPDVMELSYESSTWQELGEKCLSCGACSMVCPTCPCYGVFDHLMIGRPAGRRERSWDSCMFKQYALVAGGHNFREARADRVKLWFTHKLKAFITEFGKPACVGCGRCIDTCPVDINVSTVVRALQGEEVMK